MGLDPGRRTTGIRTLTAGTLTAVTLTAETPDPDTLTDETPTAEMGAISMTTADAGFNAGSNAEPGADSVITVTFLTRSTCGSCGRVRKQIQPVLQAAVAAGQRVEFEEVDVDTDMELAAEFGDRVPVILINDEEFSAWEVDNEELAAALGV